MTAILIPDELAQEYALRARAANCDTETYIREALITKLEDDDDIRIALERLAGPQPCLSLEEVKRDLGLDD
jgi:predicted DNA-binding protein